MSERPLPGADRSNGQRWVQLGGLALLLVTVLVVMRPFLVPVAWAGIFAVTSWPLFRLVERSFGGRTAWAAAAMTALTVFVAVGPALLVSFALASEIEQAFKELKAWAKTPEVAVPGWMRDVPWIGPQVAERAERLAAEPEIVQQWIVSQFGRRTGDIASAVGNVGRGLARAGVALLTLFFFYRDGAALLPRIETLARRLAGERVHAMFHPLGETVRAVMYGMLFTALAQGALAMLGYWVAGLGAPALLGTATTLLALIPFGAPMVYVPASLWLMAQGRMLAGLLLFAWGMLVVSTVDNVIRSWFISGATRVPFLLVFFAVLGGLAAFGSIGLFLGPISIALLLGLWREWTDPDAEPA